MKPPFYWIGSKGWMENHLKEYLPPYYNEIHIPFFGRGDLLRILRQYGYKGTAYCSDINQRVIKAHRGIKDQLDDVLRLLETHKKKHSWAYFMYIRGRYSHALDDLLVAADFIYMMNVCYKGILKENSDGYCTNVPKRDTFTFNKKAITDLSSSLQNSVLTAEDFAPAILKSKAGDLVLMDAHYVDASGYGSKVFNDADQMRLAYNCCLLHANDVHFIAMNSDCSFVRHLYRNFIITEIEAPRTLGRKRVNGKAKELIITNY